MGFEDSAWSCDSVGERIVIVAENLTPALLQTVYREGYYAMGDDESPEIAVVCRSRRCLLPIGGIHISRSLLKVIRRQGFTVTTDTGFEEVMNACRRAPGENWITPALIRAYVRIHDLGWAHSVEVRRDGELVGGSYGIRINRTFVAESMFHRATDMSKVALAYLVRHCQRLGFLQFDAQEWNSHLASLGAYMIPQSRYLKELNREPQVDLAFHPLCHAEITESLLERPQ
jgi:leucyl/phenylalanyl-tRNA---protein transferase